VNLYRVFPEPRQMLSLDEDSSHERLREWYRPEGESSCRLTLISSSSGRLTGSDGTSYSLSNPADRAILRAQRHYADAIVSGASTIRKEAVPVPAHAPLVVVTRSGNLEGHQVSEHSFRPGGVIVVSRSDAEYDGSTFFPEGVASTLTVAGTDNLTASEIVDALNSRGYHHLLVEGGQTLATVFADEGSLGEVCLALTGPPLSENHPPLPWWSPSWGQWTSRHVLSDDQKYLYFRYVPEPLN
jgi:riboflavin biosynthesis pyrimidine reductase